MWRNLLIGYIAGVLTVALLLGLIIAIPWWLDRPQREFMSKVHLGMTEAEVISAVGQPYEVYAGPRLDEALPGFRMSYEGWLFRHGWPTGYTRVLMYRNRLNTGDLLFFDSAGKLVYVIVGKT